MLISISKKNLKNEDYILESTFSQNEVTYMIRREAETSQLLKG